MVRITHFYKFYAHYAILRGNKCNMILKAFHFLKSNYMKNIAKVLEIRLRGYFIAGLIYMYSYILNDHIILWKIGLEPVNKTCLPVLFPLLTE